jgi:hypothetical protein
MKIFRDYFPYRGGNCTDPLSGKWEGKHNLTPPLLGSSLQRIPEGVSSFTGTVPF